MFYFNSAGLLGLARIHWRSDIVRTGYYLSVSNQANQTNLGGQVKTLWFLDVFAYVNLKKKFTLWITACIYS